METCFVIQPFDRGKFDKRFEDTFTPAIEEAGLHPYRVDRDPKVEVLIDAIEQGIRDAVICLADITTDNPNVWYELGYAFAAGKPVVMVCSTEREARRYPFDIQHRTVVSYRSESRTDFEELKENIRGRIEALLRKGERLRQIAQSDSVAPREGMSQTELAVLAVLAGDSILGGSATSIYSLRSDVEQAGFTRVGFALGFRRLTNKELVRSTTEYDERGEEYPAARVTQAGWDWIDKNEALFLMKKVQPEKNVFDDDIPF